jgi:hypothetical protein
VTSFTGHRYCRLDVVPLTGGSLTVTHVLFVAAPHASARALAESMLNCFGINAAAVAGARHYTAQTESAAVGLPLGVDYHAFHGSDLPARVSAVSVSGSYLRKVRDEFAHVPELASYLFGATHLVRVAHEPTEVAADAADEAITRFSRHHRVRRLQAEKLPS